MLYCFCSLRKEEVAALSGPNEFAEFYSRLRGLKDYHRKFPNEVFTNPTASRLLYEIINFACEFSKK